MSFLTKYNEYALGDENLLAWHEMAGLIDSGPLGNDLTLLAGTAPVLGGQKAHFNDTCLSLTNDDWSELGVQFRDYFTAFLDFEKMPHEEPDIILSNNSHLSMWGPYLQQGFFLGCNQNGDFFLFVSSGEGLFIKFFKTIKTANRAILVFSRQDNIFSLSSYSPISKQLESETITVPSHLNLGAGLKIKLGNAAAIAPIYIETCKFNLYEFALVGTGLPDFVCRDLCEEIYVSSGSVRQDYLFTFVSVSDKVTAHYLERIDYNLGELDTQITLPFSAITDGFSLLGNIPDSGARFFANGNPVDADLFDNYIQYDGQTSLDEVVFDNFASGVNEGLSYTKFSGHCTGLFPKNRPALYLNSGSGRTIQPYITLDSGSLCYNKTLVFPWDQTLNRI